MVVRENFEKDLQELKEQMIEMSELTISALEKAFTALQTQDVELALEVIDEDAEIDQFDADIDQFIVWLIAKEQPVARDLRRIIGALKITSEIERIADFAVNIAKGTIRIGKTASLLEITHLERMKDISIEMLKKALEAFFDEDMGLAREVEKLDDQVDSSSDATTKLIMEYMRDHPEETPQMIQLLLINRHIERTADHITNIAESAAYLIKGRKYDLNS